MASSKEYMEFIMEQLSSLEDIQSLFMMGEYVVYYRDKVVGGIFDNRFLIKPVPSAVRMMPNAQLAIPYDGAKSMLMVDNLENSDFLRDLFETIYNELPQTKRRKKESY
jgi:TfoX/Sxy family transcriptional regulator of competence genes